MNAALLVVALLFFFLAAAVVTLIAGLLPFLLIIFLFGLGIGICVFWVWMLVDAIVNPGLGTGEKVAWVLAIVFLHLLAAALYFFIGRPKRNRSLGPPAGLQHAPH